MKINMDERKRKILAAVVEEYTKTALPAGSDVIAEEYVGASPATIRAEMAELEKEGYLYQPHTSSGRIPTDKGFRFYVDRLMREKPLSAKELQELEIELLKTKAQYNRLARTAAKLLSHFAKTYAIAGLIDNEDIRCESGIKEFLASPDFTDLDQVAQAAEILDYLDEWMDQIIMRNLEKPTTIYIGGENPISKLRGYSMIISKIDFPDGKQGYIALVGQKRMKYNRNLSLVECVRRFLE